MAKKPGKQSPSEIFDEGDEHDETQDERTNPSPAKSAAVLEVERQEQIAKDEAALQAEGQRRQQMVSANASKPALNPATAFPGEQTDTMISPREFMVQLNDGRKVRFVKGAQEVCESLQEHPYVKAHKVERYKGGA